MDDSEQAGWHARLYRPGDEEGIVALYEGVFGYKRSPEWWRWKTKGLPAREELTWVAVADDDGRIVGHLGGISGRMKIAGEIHPAIVNVDAMTAPEFRRQGILLKLGEEANRHWKEAGYVAVVGLPNEQWGTRAKMLGWQTLFPLEWLRFPLHLGRVLARPGRYPRPMSVAMRVLGEAVARAWARPRISRLGRGVGVEVEEVRGAGDIFDRLWAALEGYYPNCLVRDARYVQWRFLDALPVPYKVLLARDGERPLGYVAYRAWSPRGGHDTYLADIFTAPGDRETVSALLGVALRDLWRAGAGVARVTAVPGSALYEALRQVGASPVGVGFHYDLIPLDPLVDVSAQADPKLWLASGSDSDVV